MARTLELTIPLRLAIGLSTELRKAAMHPNCPRPMRGVMNEDAINISKIVVPVMIAAGLDARTIAVILDVD